MTDIVQPTLDSSPHNIAALESSNNAFMRVGSNQGLRVLEARMKLAFERKRAAANKYQNQLRRVTMSRPT